jgi:DNA-binding MarR family transcriptional regulator
MKEKSYSELLKEFAVLWYKLFSSNKLDVCAESLADIAPVDIHILRLVAEDNDIILKEICQRLNIVNSTLTSAINRLEKRKFIRRIISKRDLRSFGLELTDQGRNALEEHAKGEEQALDKVLKSLKNDAERKAFVIMFKKIVENMIQE